MKPATYLRWFTWYNLFSAVLALSGVVLALGDLPVIRDGGYLFRYPIDAWFGFTAILLLEIAIYLATFVYLRRQSSLAIKLGLAHYGIIAIAGVIFGVPVILMGGFGLFLGYKSFGAFIDTTSPNGHVPE